MPLCIQLVQYPIGKQNIIASYLSMTRNSNLGLVAWRLIMYKESGDRDHYCSTSVLLPIVFD